MDEPGLRQLLNADVVLDRLLLLPLGWLLATYVVTGQDDIAGAFAGALGAAALTTAPGQLTIQLLEELAITDVDGLGTRQLSADSLGSTLFSAKCQCVAGVISHILQVNLGHASWHGVEVGSLLQGEGAGGSFLVPLKRGALHGTWKHRQRDSQATELDQDQNHQPGNPREGNDPPTLNVACRVNKSNINGCIFRNFANYLF